MNMEMKKDRRKVYFNVKKTPIFILNMAMKNDDGKAYFNL